MRTTNIFLLHLRASIVLPSKSDTMLFRLAVAVIRRGEDMPIAPHPKELQALDDADILLKYALENKKDVPAEAILAIENAWQAQAQQQWSPDIAQKFAVAFNTLCLLIAPVTIDTIATNEPVFAPALWRQKLFGAKTKHSQAFRFAERCLALLLGLLVLAAALGYGVNTVKSLSDGIDVLLKSGNDAVVPIATDADELAAKFGDSSFDASKKASLIDDNTRKAISLLQAKVHDLDSIESNALQKAYQLDAIISLGLKPTGNPLGYGTVSSVPQVRSAVTNYYAVRDGVRKKVQDAAIIVSIINASILPIILGAMGACAYVVRMVADQIKLNTFSKNSPIRHVSRIGLGGLAGIVIGFGAISTTDVAISAAALAFIAGYAIEPVFATLDKIASSFK